MFSLALYFYCSYVLGSETANGKQEYRKEIISIYAGRPHSYEVRLHDYSLIHGFCIKTQVSVQVRFFLQ